jgi:hypothetical protein
MRCIEAKPSFMKSLILFLSLLTFSSALLSQVNLNQGLVAYYPSMGNANDMSGNNNNPSFNNATLTTDRNGIADGAYFFNGSSSYMRIPNSPSLNPQRISICAVVKPMGFYHGPCHASAIVNKSNSDNSFPPMYRLRFDDNLYTHGANCSNNVPDTAHENFYADYGGNGAISTAYIPYVELNKWYCLVFTYDGSVSKFYINGTLIQSKAGNAVYQDDGSDLFFGKMNDSLFPYWFNGVIDEIRIYNRAINADEVNSLCSDCSNIIVQGGNESIKIKGINAAPIVGVQVFDSNWASVYSQTYPGPQDSITVSSLPAGQYFVNVRFYTINWAVICEKGSNATVISNQPPVPTLSINDVTVNESAGNAVLQVCLSATSTQQVTVQFATANGTATAGSDYTASTGTVTIPAGQTCANVSVPIINDAVAEPTETFTVNLSSPVNATIGTGTGTVTINDDDQSQYNCSALTFTPGNQSIVIGGMTAPVATVQIFNSSWATVFNQTYTNAPGTVTVSIAPGVYNVKVTFYTASWGYICDITQSVTVVNQCPNGSICAFNTCPSLSVNLNNAYSIGNLPPGTVVSWHTGTPATDANRMTAAQAQNVTTSGTYYAAINISGNNCYSNTIPVIVTINPCNTITNANSLQIKTAGEMPSGKIAVYPNPFTNSVRVIIQSEKNEQATLVLTDMMGQQLQSRSIQLVRGGNQFTLEGLDKFPSGSYFLKVNSSVGIQTFKLLRQQ